MAARVAAKTASGTRVIASYEIADNRWSLPGEIYDTGSIRPVPGLNVYFRQPVPSSPAAVAAWKPPPTFATSWPGLPLHGYRIRPERPAGRNPPQPPRRPQLRILKPVIGHPRSSVAISLVLFLLTNERLRSNLFVE